MKEGITFVVSVIASVIVACRGLASSGPDCGAPVYTLCYAIVLPGRNSAFRAGFWLDCYRDKTEIGPARPIYGPETLLRNIVNDSNFPVSQSHNLRPPLIRFN